MSAAKFHRAAYNQISVGTRFGMMIETEDSGKRRFMGTVVAINDCDPLRWPNSKWRNLQVRLIIRIYLLAEFSDLHFMLRWSGMNTAPWRGRTE